MKYAIVCNILLTTVTITLVHTKESKYARHP